MKKDTACCTDTADSECAVSTSELIERLEVRSGKLTRSGIVMAVICHECPKPRDSAGFENQCVTFTDPAVYKPSRELWACKYKSSVYITPDRVVTIKCGF